MKVVLIALAALLLLYTFSGISRGTISCKGVTYDRDNSPLGFWFSIVLFWVLAGMILVLVLSGKIR